MQTVTVWAAGYRIDETSVAPPVHMATIDVSSLTLFRQACQLALSHEEYYNRRTNEYWGCKLFPSEAEALEYTNTL